VEKREYPKTQILKHRGSCFNWRHVDCRWGATLLTRR